MNTFFAGSLVGSLVGTVTVLVFQHFMVIKPYIDLLTACRGD